MDPGFSSARCTTPTCTEIYPGTGVPHLPVQKSIQVQGYHTYSVHVQKSIQVQGYHTNLYRNLSRYRGTTPTCTEIYPGTGLPHLHVHKFIQVHGYHTYMYRNLSRYRGTTPTCTKIYPGTGVPHPHVQKSIQVQVYQTCMYKNLSKYRCTILMYRKSIQTLFATKKKGNSTPRSLRQLSANRSNLWEER